MFELYMAASEAASHGAEGGHEGGLLSPQPGLIFWTILTFVILLLLLRKLAWGPMLSMIDQREKTIRESLERSEQARTEAERILADQKRILEDARRESQELLERSRQDGERARESLLAKARDESQKLVEDGKQAILQEKKAALQEIRGVAVDLALAAAGKLVDVNVDDQRQRELVKGFVEELESSAGSESIG